MVNDRQLTWRTVRIINYDNLEGTIDDVIKLFQDLKEKYSKYPVKLKELDDGGYDYDDSQCLHVLIYIIQML